MAAARDDHRGNRMLEDELLLVAGFEDHRVLVERSDTARQLHPADQIDRDIVPFLACRVEEGILNVLLRRLGFHLPISFYRVRCCSPNLHRKRHRPPLSYYRLLPYLLVTPFF